MYDCVIIGGGIIGLATACELLARDPTISLVLLEKEDDLALHQSGHNSGVIHSGIYYKPGSLKAKTCFEGKELLEQLARESGIAFEMCGKVIVACDTSELVGLQRLFERGKQNGVRVEMLDAAGLKAKEPAVRGLAAVYVPEAGIIDYPAVCAELANRIRSFGGEIRTGNRVNAVNERADSITVSLSNNAIQTRSLINCAGLYSDVIAKAAGEQLNHQIIPFRGEYYELKPRARSLVKNLIYPVPNPQFPFLGVHFTRMISGAVECGPNAVLGLSREGYSWNHIHLKELCETLLYPGFWHLSARHPREGIAEIIRSLSKRSFHKALSRLIPEVEMHDIIPNGAGVRAQAVTRTGGMIDDFLFAGEGRITHVLNAPSPAATASLAIAKVVVKRHLQNCF